MTHMKHTIQQTAPKKQTTLMMIRLDYSLLIAFIDALAVSFDYFVIILSFLS